MCVCASVCESVKARTHRDEFRARYSPTFNAS